MNPKRPDLQYRKVETVVFLAEIAYHYVLLLVKSSCGIPQDSFTIPDHALKYLN